MGDEDQAGDQSYFKSNGVVSSLLGREVEGEGDEPKNKNPSDGVDKKIDQVVAKNIEATEIEVKGKGEVGKEADALRITVGQEP